MMHVRIYTTPARKGFTIVELLVVILIISVLIALLLPALAMAQRTARQVVCLNKLQQIGLAEAMYAQTNNATLPPVFWQFTPTTGTNTSAGWIQFLVPYLLPGEMTPPYGPTSDFVWAGSTQQKSLRASAALLCPEQILNYPLVWWDATTYGMNRDLPPYLPVYHVTNGVWSPAPIDSNFPQLSQVVDPAATCLVADGNFDFQYPPGYTWAFISIDSYNIRPPGWIETPNITGPGVGVFQSGEMTGAVHPGGDNVLFCDFHAATIEPSQIPTVAIPSAPSLAGSNVASLRFWAGQ